MSRSLSPSLFRVGSHREVTTETLNSTIWRRRRRRRIFCLNSRTDLPRRDRPRSHYFPKIPLIDALPIISNQIRIKKRGGRDSFDVSISDDRKSHGFIFAGIHF